MGFIPEGARWYLADIVSRVHHRRGRLYTCNVVHINTHLAEAESPEEAYEKAVGLGRLSEHVFLNTESKQVRVVFRGLRGLDVVHDPLEDGAEVAYSESVGVSEEELSRWLVPKERLGIFAPRRSNRDGPNYLPQSVMRSLESAGFDRSDLEERG